MTVDEYLAKFNRLTKYFPKFVPDEPRRARKFQLGLHLDMGGRIAAVHFETMDVVVMAANRDQTYNDTKQKKKHAWSS